MRVRDDDQHWVEGMVEEEEEGGADF